MTASGSVDRGFSDRLRPISVLGLGLSVDVYSPNLIELVNCLTGRGLSPGYLEIFKATTSSLEVIRRHLAGTTLSYHGEGLWITHPESRNHGTFDTAAAKLPVHFKWSRAPG